MGRKNPLRLYEEIMLLALHDHKGTVLTGYSETVVAGAVLAELLLERRISLDNSPKKFVELRDASPTGDPILDECMQKIKSAKKRATLPSWISRLEGIKQLRHRVARHLCDRGILRADEAKLLLIFSKKVYPELDPVPENEIIERLRAAVFADNVEPTHRTIVLVALADASNLMAKLFGRKEVKSRQARIEQLVQGDIAGMATREVIEACETAILLAMIVPP